MELMNELDIIKLVESDQWMMNILEKVQTLHLPDWWICAGFVRSKIWNTLHGFKERTPTPDSDVIFFDPTLSNQLVEIEMEDYLTGLDPTIPWSVKNQARMHIKNNIEPYTSSIEAISKFPEIPTALGLTLARQNEVVLTAPHGIQDLINLEVKPTPFFLENESRMKIYEKRIIKKNGNQFGQS